MISERTSVTECVFSWKDYKSKCELFGFVDSSQRPVALNNFRTMQPDDAAGFFSGPGRRVDSSSV
jgi:hypothetical protein